MAKIPTVAPTTIAESSRKALGHATDAGKGVFAAGKEAFVNANGVVRDTIAREKGVWGAVKYGARQQPLLTGAAAVTGAYVVGTKVMGGHEQRAREARASQEQGLQR